MTSLRVQRREAGARFRIDTARRLFKQALDQTKVQHLDLAAFVDHYVRGFDVSMNDAVVMSLAQRIGH